MLRLQMSYQPETQSGGGTYDSPTTCTATSALGTPMLTAMCSRRHLSFLAATDLGQNRSRERESSTAFEQRWTGQVTPGGPSPGRSETAGLTICASIWPHSLVCTVTVITPRM